MKIIVCVKQVPDTHSVRIDPETHTLMREGAPAITNPFDLCAIEEALRLRAQCGGTVIALTMGPPQAEAVLRETVARGADAGVLLTDRAFAGSDTWATSLTLATAIRKLGGADLILCGRQASDGDTAQVGPGIAAHLDLPQVTYVRRIGEVSDAWVVVERTLDDGFETIRAQRPCVLAIGREIHPVRMPSLAGLLRARAAPPTRWGASDLGLDPASTGLSGSPTRVVRIAAPAAHSRCVFLPGPCEAAAAALAAHIGRLCR